MSEDASPFDDHRIAEQTESGIPNISSWDITKSKLKRTATRAGFKFVSIVNRVLPESLTRKWDPHAEKSVPYWLGKINHTIENNSKLLKYGFYALAVMIFISFVLIPGISIFTEYRSTDKYVTDMKIISPDKAEGYANAIKHNFEVWKRKAIEKQRRDDVDASEADHRGSNVDSFDDIMGTKGSNNDKDERKEAEEDASDAAFLQAMTEEINQKNICTRTLEFGSIIKPKKMCYDVVKYMLDRRFNRAYRADKKQPQKQRTEEMTCLCSDYFGLRSEFVYMAYPGEPSKLFINPILYPESDKNLISYTISQPKGTNLAALDERLREVTNSKPSILQPKKIKVSYHTLPEKSEIEKYFPTTADIPTFVKKISIRDRVGSTGNPLIDGLLWIAQALEWMFSPLFGYNEPVYDQKEISKIMEYRMERKYVNDQQDSESSGGFKIIKNLFKSDARAGEQLDYKEMEEVEMPQSSCLLYCKRFHQKLAR